MLKKIDKMDKKSKKIFFNRKRGVFYQKLHEESEKNGPTLYKYYFSRKLGFFQEFLAMSFFLQLHTAERVTYR